MAKLSIGTGSMVTMAFHCIFIWACLTVYCGGSTLTSDLPTSPPEGEFMSETTVSTTTKASISTSVFSTLSTKETSDSSDSTSVELLGSSPSIFTDITGRTTNTSSKYSTEQMSTSSPIIINPEETNFTTGSILESSTTEEQVSTSDHTYMTSGVTSENNSTTSVVTTGEMENITFSNSTANPNMNFTFEQTTTTSNDTSTQFTMESTETPTSGEIFSSHLPVESSSVVWNTHSSTGGPEITSPQPTDGVLPPEKNTGNNNAAAIGISVTVCLLVLILGSTVGYLIWKRRRRNYNRLDETTISYENPLFGATFQDPATVSGDISSIEDGKVTFSIT